MAAASDPQQAPNPHKSRSGLDRMRHAAGYSFGGLMAAYRGERSFRQECWVALLLVPAAWWLGDGWVQMALLTAAALQVLIVELLNSAIEAAVDRVSLDWHPLSKRAKDIGSAAVLLSLLLCALVWGAALWHRFT